MGSRKAQASAEYLLNYAIAGIVIAIVIGVLAYLGWLFPSRPPICVFQKGILCDTHYMQEGNDIASIRATSKFEDAVVIYGVLCSGEQVDPSTALPIGRTWTSAPVGPQINGQLIIPGNEPTVHPSEFFTISVYCYTNKGAGIGTLSKQERYQGIVFIKYRLESSPAMFTHVMQGNLQGNPN